jgi:hypothetical protein
MPKTSNTTSTATDVFQFYCFHQANFWYRMSEVNTNIENFERADFVTVGTGGTRGACHHRPF